MKPIGLMFQVATMMAMAACGGTTPTNNGDTRNATLTGASEVPAVTTSATGTAVVNIDAARANLAVAVSYLNLTGVTMAHIHKGSVTEAGPILFDLSTTAFSSPLTKVLTASDLKPNQGTFADAISAILNGGTYVNVHTTANAGGEIRGQLLLQ